MLTLTATVELDTGRGVETTGAGGAGAGALIDLSLPLPPELDAQPGQGEPPAQALPIGDDPLLGRDRAIVSPIPGTTRDTIEETANVRGIPVVFVDTAGLREAGDEIEMEGIRRSRESLTNADLVLHVLDASEPWTAADSTYLAEFSTKKRILVQNKMYFQQCS